MTSPHLPELPERIASTLEWLAKVAGSLVLLWGFVAKIWMPLTKWRDKHLAATIRDCLAPELKHVSELTDIESGWVARSVRFEKKFDDLYEMQNALLDLAIDNQERHNETNDLLDALGFTTDRRSNEDRRQEARALIDELERRRRDRRKHT